MTSSSLPSSSTSTSSYGRRRRQRLSHRRMEDLFNVAGAKIQFYTWLTVVCSSSFLLRLGSYYGPTTSITNQVVVIDVPKQVQAWTTLSTNHVVPQNSWRQVDTTTAGHFKTIALGAVQGTTRSDGDADSSGSEHDNTPTTFTDVLVDHVRHHDTTPLVFTGYVLAKRSLSKHLVFLDLIAHKDRDNDDDDNNGDTDHGLESRLCQAILKRDDYGCLELTSEDGEKESSRPAITTRTTSPISCQHDDSDDDWYDEYEFVRKGFLHRGTKLKLVGVASPTNNPGNVILSIRTVELLALPRQVQHIESILKLTAQKFVEQRQQQPSRSKNRKIECVLSQVTRVCHLGTTSETMEFQQRLLELHVVTTTNRRREWRSLAMQIFQTMEEDCHQDPFFPRAFIETTTSSSFFLSRRQNMPPSSSLTTKSEESTDLIHSTHDTNSKTTLGGDYMVQQAPLQYRSAPLLFLEGQETTVEQDFTSVSVPCLEALQKLPERSVSGRFSVEGWVQNRRRFAKNIAVITIVDDLQQRSGDDDTAETINRLKCILHPDLLHNGQVALYRNLLAVGAKVNLSGRMTTHAADKKNGAFWVESIRLLQSTFQPATIQFLLENIDLTGHDRPNYKNGLSMEEAAQALRLSTTEKVELEECLSSFSSSERQWKANRLSVRLQEVTAKRSSHLNRRLTKYQSVVLEKYKHMLEQYSVSTITNFWATASEKKVVKNPSDSIPLAAKSVAARMPGGRWQTRKLPQIEWMRDAIQNVLSNHPDYGKRKLRVLDIGGGKGSLAHYLVGTIDNVHIHVVDICEGAVKNGLKKAQLSHRMQTNKYGPTAENSMRSTIDFQWADASTSEDLANVDADLIVALHACGHLSDVALAHAVGRQASFVIAPCCFNSNKHLTIPSPSQLVHEWLGIPENDWSTLKSVAEVQGDNGIASLGMHIICAIRAKATERKAKGRTRVEILRFPLEYSTRNTVLVGKAY